jgi:DNA-binding XRE family transcriptional regulator
MTQKDLAQAVESSLGSIKQIEVGIRLPSIAVLQKIAEALECRMVIDLKKT